MSTETFTFRSAMPASAGEVYAWHARPGAFARLTPPWEDVRVEATEGRFGVDGHRVTIRVPVLGPVRRRWVAEAFDFKPGELFRDRQVRGPFRSWVHTHRFVPSGLGESVLEDHVEYRVPLGPFGRALGGHPVRDRLAALFAYRHAVTASDLARHGRYHGRRRLKVVVTGSRGLIGADLTLFLTTGGHSVVRLVSGPVPDWAPDDGTRWVAWDPRAKIPPDVLDGCDAVVHLAGDNVAEGRWTAAKKRSIRESRTVPTRHLAEAIAAVPHEHRPRVFVSASAVGFYGDRGDEVLTEESPAGTGFLADVCKEWEAAADPARAADVRVVHPRIGVVLSPRGAALGKQLLPFRLGAGATLGSGRQWVSWITVGDVVGALYHCLMSEPVSGPVNFTAPNPVTNREFTRVLGRVLRRPAVMWLPRPALRLAFGEVADAALLASMRAVPRKLLDAGFAFDHTELEPALRFLLGR